MNLIHKPGCFARKNSKSGKPIKKINQDHKIYTLVFNLEDTFANRTGKSVNADSHTGIVIELNGFLLNIGPGRGSGNRGKKGCFFGSPWLGWFKNIKHHRPHRHCGNKGK